MKYRAKPKVQFADFSCLEELKVDVIENLLRFVDTPCCYISILTNNITAEQLYTKLLKSVVNGFEFRLFDKYTPNDISKCVSNNKIVFLSLFNDGEISIDDTQRFENTAANFIYIDSTIDSCYLQVLNNQNREILIFNVK